MSATDQYGQMQAQCAGNNPYGSIGRQKCAACRTRRKKCEFDETRPDLPCVYCHKTGQGATCVKVFSTKAPTTMPSPPESSGDAEFKLSEVCSYYEDRYPGANPQVLLGYLCTHVQAMVRQEQEDEAAAAVAAAQQPQFAQPMGQEAQYGYQTQYQTQTQYAPTGVQQYVPQTFSADPMPQGYGGIDPNVLQTQPQQPPMYYPQTPQWGYGGNMTDSYDTLCWPDPQPMHIR